MATLSDISKQLGVSVATVSNALTGKGRMREELRQEIITAASDMGYAPTGNARLPVTENIIVIAEDISVSFCADIVGGVFSYTLGTDKSFSVYRLRTLERCISLPDEETIKIEIKKLHSTLKNRNITGIIFIADTPRRFENLFDSLACPVVYVYCQNSGVAPAINYNDRQGARLATSTLISHGAKKIAMFSGLLDSIPMSNRMFGYQLALSDAKLPFDPSLLYIGDWSIDSGYKLASEMIKSGKIPDAIFSQNDEMAAGICQAFAKHGISIPDEVEIIGFDDKELAEYTFPPLSTVRPPLQKLGFEAAKMILELQSDSSKAMKNDKPVNIYLPCELIERGTTKKQSK